MSKKVQNPWCPKPIDEIISWMMAIVLLPVMIPLIGAALLFAVAMIIFDKVNDGFGH
jgi:hypothetical protein